MTNFISIVFLASIILITIDAADGQPTGCVKQTSDSLIQNSDIGLWIHDTTIQNNCGCALSITDAIATPECPNSDSKVSETQSLSVGGVATFSLQYGLTCTAIGPTFTNSTCNSHPSAPPLTPPSGSYRKSCQDAQIINNRDVPDGELIAKCLNKSGVLGNTGLFSYRACIGDISNIDGNLDCGRTNLPLGSYRETCAGMTLGGINGPDNPGGEDYLDGTCRTKRGNWHGISWGDRFDVSKCTGSITNIDGYLSCPLTKSTFPGGSWVNSCVNPSLSASGDLSAACEDKRGIISGASTLAPPSTVLRAATQCNGNIANSNGILVCIR